MSADTVFHNRSALTPTISLPGNRSRSLRSNASRHGRRDLCPPPATNRSRASSASIIESTPATFSVPARRPSSCLPPTNNGAVREWEGHLRKPTPFGPPNLCAHPLTKSQLPSPRAGSFPTHCAASQKNGTLASWHIASASRQGCNAPVSLFAAITATSAGFRFLNPSRSQSKSTTPARDTGMRRVRFGK
jgi:hypothetical protein